MFLSWKRSSETRNRQVASHTSPYAPQLAGLLEPSSGPCGEVARVKDSYRHKQELTTVIGEDVVRGQGFKENSKAINMISELISRFSVATNSENNLPTYFITIMVRVLLNHSGALQFEE